MDNPKNIFIKYPHHTEEEVSVRKELKGRHKDFCLCYSCDKFKPNTPENCPIANEVYTLCVQENLVLPVWECPAFEVAPEQDAARKALKRLISFVPEAVRPEYYAELFGFSAEDFADVEDVPFLTESFLYAAIGKMDARTVLALLRTLCETLGYDLHTLFAEARNEEWEY